MTDPTRIDLSGEWAFRIDPDDTGRAEQWWSSPLPDRVKLPGSLQEQGHGCEVTATTEWVATAGGAERAAYPDWWTHPMYAGYRDERNLRFPYWLQPRRHYVGTAWYQRTVRVPDSWAGARVTLTLERCHWRTAVWLDDRALGEQDSLSTPHTYDLTGVSAGAHTLTIAVDNRLAADVGVNGHSVTDHTQTAWNGIVGRITLEATDLVWLDGVDVYPDAASELVRFVVRVGNAGAEAVTAELSASVDGGSPPVPLGTAGVEAGGSTTVTGDVRVTEPACWDEFDPVLHRAEVALDASGGERSVRSETTVRFGFRRVGTAGTRFTVNDRTTFLRGTVECCVFPDTGYPPTDAAEWRRIMGAVRRYGLNHVRFHSWCPPEAAFLAADEAGVYLHAECSLWNTVHSDSDLSEYLARESSRILAEYGNHPSFAMFGLGNESYVDPGCTRALLEAWKGDPRRIYTGPANDNPSVVDEYEYYIAVHLDYQRVRNQMGWPPAPEGSWWVVRPPRTTDDYRAAVGSYANPLVSHEVGQRCAYPDPADVDRYTGSLYPAYLDIARDQLTARGMADQVQDFVAVSGRWQVEQYKEEVEAALRTDGFGGFQLLQLNDFPGQGTALVGVLDAFWREKGYVSGQRWRRFCAPTVPLLRAGKRTWTTEESLEATVQVAHFGPRPLDHGTAHCRLTAGDGTLVWATELGHDAIPAGGTADVGTVSFRLSDLRAPAAYRLEVDVAGHVNDWDFWVYPSRLDTPTGDVVVTTVLDGSVRRGLQRGDTVLLSGARTAVGGSPRQCFTSMYWNSPWTGGGEAQTLGILADTEHPALAGFVTDRHTNWQWHELLADASPLILDGHGVTARWPRAYRPIVQVVDDWNQNRKLAVAAEARVGEGRLLVCAADLETDLDRRVVARQLRHSLLGYMRGDAFDPGVRLDQAHLDVLS